MSQVSSTIREEQRHERRRRGDLRSGEPNRASGGDVRSACPVLARIPEATTRRSQPTGPLANAASVSTASPAKRYRIDPSQAFAPLRSRIASLGGGKKQRSAVPAGEKSTADDVDSLPIPIRIAVMTWQLFQPHQLLVRAAAVFVLAALAGTSIIMMASNNTASTDPSDGSMEIASEVPTSRDAAEQATELESLEPPVVAPETAATPSGPTAIGPANREPRGRRSIDDVQPVAPRQIATTAGHGYPVTPYPQFSLSGAPGDTMPRVQTADEQPAVAKFRGDVQAIPPR